MSEENTDAAVENADSPQETLTVDQNTSAETPSSGADVSQTVNRALSRRALLQAGWAVPVVLVLGINAAVAHANGNSPSEDPEHTLENGPPYHADIHKDQHADYTAVTDPETQTTPNPSPENGILTAEDDEMLTWHNSHVDTHQDGHNDLGKTLMPH